ncbi:MAG: DUF4372 domain-containing protein [Ferruginibacter sp.]
MNQGTYLFSQLISLISSTSFKTCVSRYKGDYKTKHFNCWRQYLCMVFGQLTHRESLSDTILCLKANSNKLYHIGIGEAIVKSTLSTANENRDWRIFSDFAWVLIKEAQQLYADEKDLEISIDNPVFAIDASTIDMCLSLFQWANFRSTKAGIKLHVQLCRRLGFDQRRIRLFFAAVWLSANGSIELYNAYLIAFAKNNQNNWEIHPVLLQSNL